MNKKSNLAKLVVTGHSSTGKAVIISDDIAPITELVDKKVYSQFLWGRDNPATFPDNGSIPDSLAPLPTPSGFRFSTLTIAAGADEDYCSFITNAMGEMAEPDNPGFHRTPSLDLITVLTGELFLEVDDGVERCLKQGDFAVLNGVRHCWHNRGTEDATITAVMLGAIENLEQ